jgi:hypothetical protein
MSYTFNTEVSVRSFYFTKGNGMRCFPRMIEFQGKELSFLDNGLRCLVQTGQSIVQIFNMTDGRNAYRLKFEPQDNLWTLLTMKSL